MSVASNASNASNASMPSFEQFRPHTVSNTACFSLATANPWIRVVSIHDGDTLTAIVESFPGRYVKSVIRLMGIDTCEMTSKRADNKGLSLAARNRLIQLVTRLDALDPADLATRGKIQRLLERDVYMVHAQFLDMDKYGRALAHLRAAPDAPVTFNQQLVDERLALVYDGGRKMTEEEQEAALLKASTPFSTDAAACLP
jgi:endonuclease YncB( thermonuclease family)